MGAVSSLVLEGDTRALSHQSVDAYLADWAGRDEELLEIKAIIHAILEGATILAARIAAGRLPGDPARLVGENTDGDRQKSIDVGSHKLFVDLLLKAGAAEILSEEADEPEINTSGGSFAVAIDPLDGSGNVGLGAPLGTLFSILPVLADGDSFLQPGKAQAAAGYVSYGNSIDLGFSVGEGLVLATMDPETGRFLIFRENVTLPAETSDLAFNASVYRHLKAEMRRYVDDCLEGKDGPRSKNFNMRWLGAAVGELHRIMQHGGLFFYVGDTRPGYELGRLRHVYEANPIAFLCAAAGGRATDGIRPILDQRPASHHGRIPLVFGSAGEVETIAGYIERSDIN